MKAPNGYGGIVKLSGNRRNPFRVRITNGWDIAPDGKKKQLYSTLGYYPTRKAAMIALAEYNQNPYDLANKKVTFEECYNSWSPKHYEKYAGAARSLKSAYKHCTPIKDMPMSDIRLKNMQDIMDSISDKSETYQTKLKTIFLKTFKFALENDIVQKDYAQFVTIVQTPIKQDIKNKFFTKDEIKAVFDNIDWSVQMPIGKKSYADAKLVDSIIIMLYTGVRIGELLNIKCSDVDLAARTIHVAGTKTDAADRIVPIHKELIPYLEKRLAVSKDYLIENADGKKILPVKYRAYFFTPFMQHIGADHTPHALRHTFISIMDTCGVPAESVVLKRIVGHANKSVTEHYTHKEIEELIHTIEKFKLP